MLRNGWLWRLVTPMLEGWQRCSGTARRTKLPPQSKSHRGSSRAERDVCVSRGTLSPPPPPSSRRHYIHIYVYNYYIYIYIYVTKSTCVRVLRARERARARASRLPASLPAYLLTYLPACLSLRNLPIGVNSVPSSGPLFRNERHALHERD